VINPHTKFSEQADILIENERVVTKKEDIEHRNSNIEKRLLNRVNSEEKARKRTRGPYRKSSL
jgi:hypothetical protein